MLDTLNAAGIFLVQTLLEMYLFILLLRFVLQIVKANFYNPVSQFVVKLTNPIVLPLRNIIPSLKNFDLVILILLLLGEIVKILVLMKWSKWTKVGYLYGSLGILLLAIAQLGSLFINFYFYAILITVILSWISPHTRNPLAETLFLITDPILAPARRYIPPIAGMDLSPIAVMILLKLMEILIVFPVMKLGFIVLSSPPVYY